MIWFLVRKTWQVEKQWRKNRNPEGQCKVGDPDTGPGVDLNRFIIISLQGGMLDAYITTGLYCSVLSTWCIRCLYFCRVLYYMFILLKACTVLYWVHGVLDVYISAGCYIRCLYYYRSVLYCTEYMVYYMFIFLQGVILDAYITTGQYCTVLSIWCI